MRGILRVSKAWISRTSRSRSTGAKAGCWDVVIDNNSEGLENLGVIVYDRRDNMLFHRQCAHGIHPKSLQRNILSQSEVKHSYQNWTWCECRQEIHVIWIFPWEVKSSLRSMYTVAEMKESKHLIYIWILERGRISLQMLLGKACRREGHSI